MPQLVFDFAKPSMAALHAIESVMWRVLKAHEAAVKGKRT